MKPLIRAATKTLLGITLTLGLTSIVIGHPTLHKTVNVDGLDIARRVLKMRPPFCCCTVSPHLRRCFAI